MSDVFVTDNPRVRLGGNNPPTPIDDARPAYLRLATFLKDNPVVETEEIAFAANEELAIGKAHLKSLGDAQSTEADPLYSQWKAARAKYQGAIDGMSNIIGEVSARLQTFMRAEEARRQREADEKRRIAEDAERAAREAERLEQEARDNAAVGEVGIDVAGAIEQADADFEAFKKAEREAAVAEKDASVRLRSRFASKATTLKNKEVLIVENASNALAVLGLTEKIEEAILSSARAYRVVKGVLPDGVSAKHERTL